MTTKKIVIIVAASLAGFALVVSLFVGAITGFVFYFIGNSDAAKTAKTFLRENERLKADIGEVRDFGFFITGDINARNSAGNAELGLKTVGERKTVNATVVMAYRDGRDWRVVDAYYDAGVGERVPLTAGFDEDATALGTGEPVAGFDEESFKANVLDAGGPVLVVLGTPSSLDSIELDKTLVKIAPKYEQKVALVRYDLSEEPIAMQRLGVKGVPAVLLFKGGEERERREGKISRAELEQLIERHLDK